jgi:hypothetical protein
MERKFAVSVDTDLPNNQIVTYINGNYTSFQAILLHQSLVLHKLGMELVKKSEEQASIKGRGAYLDLALRALSQSQKAMNSIKFMKGERI